MIKSKGRRITWFVLTLILAMGMVGSSVFAAVNPQTDEVNGKSDIERQQAYEGENATASDPTIAKVNLTKEHLGPFRGIKEFKFLITPEAAWFNDNVNSTSNGDTVNGTAGTAADCPELKLATKTTNPATDKAEFAPNTGGAGWVLTLGDYSKNNAHDTADAARMRGADLQFKDFTRAGYYIYHVKEITDTNYESKGVTYDKDEYDLVVYVANKVQVDDDATQGQPGAGTYIHSITRWRTAQGKTNAQDIIKNINSGNTYDGNKDMGTNSDADGQVAADTDSKYTKDATEGKETITDRKKPNEIDVRFDNKEDAKNIEVEKKVTGTLGDLTKKFEFTLAISELSPGEYAIGNATDLKLDKTANVEVGANKYTTSNNVELSGNKIVVSGTTDATAVLTFKLKSGEKLVVTGLPVNTKYQVMEAKSDHQPMYDISGNGEKITIAQAKAKGVKAEMLATALECIDNGDGTVTILYTNHRDITTETGIPGYVFPIVLAAMIALIGLAVVRRRNNVSSVNDFEF